MSTVRANGSVSVEIAAGIRAITPDEVAFYHENGWVMLERLVAPEVADDMRSVAEELLAREDDAKGASGLAHRGLEPFHSVMFCETMAQNAQHLADRRRLTDRDIPLRYRVDMIACKRAHGEWKETGYHQDSSEHGSDRVGEMQFWLALVEITPEMGAMRFLSGMHREVPLGTVARSEAGDLLQQYEKLAELYPLSPPLHYQPGDATVHHGYMAHGAPPNTTDRDRLAYLYSYVPADTRWWGGTTANSGGERVLLADDDYPVVALRQGVP